MGWLVLVASTWHRYASGLTPFSLQLPISVNIIAAQSLPLMVNVSWPLTSSQILIMAKLEDLPTLMTSDKFRRSQII